MSSTINFRKCLLAGLPMILLSIILVFVNPSKNEHLPKGFSTPILAFEFIETPEEVNAFFDVEDVEAYKQKMLTGNKIDYFFMFTYTGFLIFLAFTLHKITLSNALLFSIILSFLALIFDALENTSIGNIINNFQEQPIDKFLYKLKLFTWLKWGSLVASLLMFSGYFINGRWFEKMIGVTCFLSFIFALPAVINRGVYNEIMAAFVALSFLLMVIYCFIGKKQVLN